MDDAMMKYEEKLWQLFDITKNEMLDLAEANYGPVKKMQFIKKDI